MDVGNFELPEDQFLLDFGVRYVKRKSFYNDCYCALFGKRKCLEFDFNFKYIFFHYSENISVMHQNVYVIVFEGLSL